MGKLDVGIITADALGHAEEISRREKTWLKFINALEAVGGGHVATLDPMLFRGILRHAIDFDGFKRR